MNKEWSTGSQRDDQEGKGRYDLLPWYSIHRVAMRMEFGAKKYGDDNWKKGQPLDQYLNSAIRHIAKWYCAEDTEDHMAAAAWNILAFMWTQKEIEEGRLPKFLGGYHEGRSVWREQPRKEKPDESE